MHIAGSSTHLATRPDSASTAMQAWRSRPVPPLPPERTHCREEALYGHCDSVVDCRRCDEDDLTGDPRLDAMKLIVERMSGRRIDVLTQRDMEPPGECCCGPGCHHDPAAHRIDVLA